MALNAAAAMLVATRLGVPVAKAAERQLETGIIKLEIKPVAVERKVAVVLALKHITVIWV